MGAAGVFEKGKASVAKEQGVAGERSGKFGSGILF